MQTDAHLDEQHRALGIELDGKRNQREQRREQDETEQRHEQAERAAEYLFGVRGSEAAREYQARRRERTQSRVGR